MYHWSQVAPTIRSQRSYSTVKLQRHSGKRDVSPSSGVRNWRDYFQSVLKFFYANSQNVSVDAPSRAFALPVSHVVCCIENYFKMYECTYLDTFPLREFALVSASSSCDPIVQRQWFSRESARTRLRNRITLIVAWFVDEKYSYSASNKKVSSGIFAESERRGWFVRDEPSWSHDCMIACLHR